MNLTRGLAFIFCLFIMIQAWGQEANSAPGAQAAPLLSPDTPAPRKKAPAGRAAAIKPDPNPDLIFTSIGTAVVKNQNVNVRGKPAFIGEVITRLKKGETVTLLEEIKLGKPKKGEPANWYRISLPANTPVWVFADYVDDASKTVKSTRLNVRAGPGENFSVIARVKKNDVLKTIRRVGDWIEIEPPTNAFAFVAAEFLEKQAILPSAPPATELAVVPPTETVNVPEPEEIKPVVETAPEPVAAAPEPAPSVASTPIEPPQEEVVVVRRVVKREGIVRKAWNIQAPTYYELESLDTGKTINYLHSPQEERLDPATQKTITISRFNLEEYRNRRVVVTGEESIDKRWRRTPVIEIESIELLQ